MSDNQTARRGAGQVVERQRKTGTFYGLRVRDGGQRYYISRPAGSTREEAESELVYVLGQIERGDWTPPVREVVERTPTALDPTFHQFASEWFKLRRHDLRPRTIEDYTWRLSNHLLPYFERHRLSQIDAQEIDRYRAAKQSEGKLSARSINMTLTLLSAILDQAVEYKYGGLDANPAKGRNRRARESRPRRSYLDTAAQIGALLDAAGELDARAAVGHPGHRHVRRRAMLATLTFAGLRLGELLALRWRDVDLAAGRLRIADAKTAAGIRDVRLRPALHDELATLKASVKDPRPDEIVFATSTGRQIGASNLRRRILAPAAALAAERLHESGQALPAGLTPHSLRRTFASLLYALGETPPVVMAEMGHTTPGLALAIYAQAMSRDDGQVEALRALVEGSAWAPAGHPGHFEAQAEPHAGPAR